MNFTDCVAFWDRESFPMDEADSSHVITVAIPRLFQQSNTQAVQQSNTQAVQQSNTQAVGQPNEDQAADNLNETPCGLLESATSERAICDQMETFVACENAKSTAVYVLTGNDEVILRALELFHRVRLIIITPRASSFATRLDITNYSWTPKAGQASTATFLLAHWSRKMPGGPLTLAQHDVGTRKRKFSDSQADPLPSEADPLLSKADPLPSKADPLPSKEDPMPFRILLLYTAWTAVVPFTMSVLRETFNNPQSYY
ncbi:hypothetical protein BV898_01058 [Hypsibius exemplaris]|uniref:Uncharacterized protein n=1 Tax=Hypsibius exemplaris TaxID=2072580 RepID=A0A1W0XD64_HYPEX|nr:hypothetical protein BV898_01058 [Hypsibius exemplaris]